MLKARHYRKSARRATSPDAQPVGASRLTVRIGTEGPP